MNEWLKSYLPNVYLIPDEFIEATKQTLYMTFWSALIGGILGIILGVVLVVTRPKGLIENRLCFELFDKVINIVRSIPFIILLSLLALTTRFIVGTTIGATAALVPLIVGIVPFLLDKSKMPCLKLIPVLSKLHKQWERVHWVSFFVFIYWKDYLVSFVSQL